MSKLSKKDENSIILCWSFYRFLIDNCMAYNDTSAFIIAFGLDNKIAYKLAKMNDIEIENADIEEFSNVWLDKP